MMFLLKVLPHEWPLLAETSRSKPPQPTALNDRFRCERSLRVTAETFLEFTLSFAINQLHAEDHRLLLPKRSPSGSIGVNGCY
jgi:hypothetical protein